MIFCFFVSSFCLLLFDFFLFVFFVFVFVVFLFVCGCFLPRYAGFVVLFCCFWSYVLVWFVLYDMGFFCLWFIYL